MERQNPQGASSRDLLLVATEQQVHAYDLARSARVTIGRHESNDIQLSSRTVSNFHAELVKEEKHIVLRDLGSTNGTYVNGKRVGKSIVSAEDRLRIGNHVLTVQLETERDRKSAFFRYQRDPDSFGPGAKGRVISLRVRSADAVKTLQADDPNDLSLPDLLKLLGTNPGSALAKVERPQERARIFVHRQRIVHAEYGDALGEKALYRLFSWQGASYEVEELDDAGSVPRTIRLPTETLIMEGMQHALELGKLVAQLPPLEVPLRLKEDCPLPLTAHSPAEIDIFQAIIRHETIAAVLEKSPLSDVRVLRLIDSLLRKGVFRVSTNSEVSMEETFISPHGALRS